MVRLQWPRAALIPHWSESPLHRAHGHAVAVFGCTSYWITRGPQPPLVDAALLVLVHHGLDMCPEVRRTVGAHDLAGCRVGVPQVPASVPHTESGGEGAGRHRAGLPLCSPAERVLFDPAAVDAVCQTYPLLAVATV